MNFWYWHSLFVLCSAILFSAINSAQGFEFTILVWIPFIIFATANHTVNILEELGWAKKEVKA